MPSKETQNKPMNTPTPVEVHMQCTAQLFWHLKDALANLRNAKDEADKLFQDQNFKYSPNDKQSIREHLDAIQELISKI